MRAALVVFLKFKIYLVTHKLSLPNLKVCKALSVNHVAVSHVLLPFEEKNPSTYNFLHVFRTEDVVYNVNFNVKLFRVPFQCLQRLWLFTMHQGGCSVTQLALYVRDRGSHWNAVFMEVS